MCAIVMTRKGTPLINPATSPTRKTRTIKSAWVSWAFLPSQTALLHTLPLHVSADAPLRTQVQHQRRHHRHRARQMWCTLRWFGLTFGTVLMLSCLLPLHPSKATLLLPCLPLPHLQMQACLLQTRRTALWTPFSVTTCQQFRCWRDIHPLTSRHV